ncbi:DUF7309 domain-containing protein [Alkaliphilus transvaalensis]|uniref:DUF7309 domain-containing protein n=1 Tax=Alkaliphilus transvaalensis TaxID=114628 RepID=UPI00047A7013|nr:hypothetical protein [Alkaliphilus transvaalensis]
MKEHLTLSKEELQELFKKAEKFRGLDPWQWLVEDDIFAVKFQNMEETIICSVLGSKGGARGIAFYVGGDGIESYFRLHEGRYDQQLEQIHITDSFVLYFDEVSKNEEGDSILLMNSGIDFGRDKELPIFRRNEPGYVPRVLVGDELELVSRILSVVNYGIEVEGLLIDLQNRRLKIEKKCPVVKVNIDGKYVNTLLSYECLKQECIESINKPRPKPCDELMLKRISKSYESSHYILEMDYFNYGVGVDDEGRPYFPAVLLIVDEGTNIVGYQITQPDLAEEAWQQYMIEWIKEKKILPYKMILRNKTLYKYLKGILSGLGIKVELRQKLDNIPAIKKQYFSNRII